MNGRIGGAATPIIMGLFLIYRYFPVGESTKEHQGPLEGLLFALGALLLIIGLVFTYKNLK
jgi:hypothetical protein